ncbi:MAG: ion transporter [Alphaproteobacteria bacterium]
MPFADSIGRFVEAPRFQYFIVALILINGVVIALETVPSAMAVYGPALILADQIILGVFVVEILMKLYAFRWAFFRNGWNVFDFLIVGISLLPTDGGLAVLRSLRILRVLRLISVVPQMRIVVHALVKAIPGMGSIVALLGLVYFVCAVMATKLFGAAFPDWFGTIGESAYTLFQIMTLESWSMGIVRPVMEEFPYAWLFFVPFILIVTFSVLNMFIAIIVNSLQSTQFEEQAAMQQSIEDAVHDEEAHLMAELSSLRAEVKELKQLLQANRGV